MAKLTIKGKVAKLKKSISLQKLVLEILEQIQLADGGSAIQQAKKIIADLEAGQKLAEGLLN